MFIDQMLLAAVKEKFADREGREGTGADPLLTFPAQSAAVGDARISARGVDSTISPVFSVEVSIGDILHDSFIDFDVHLDERARVVERLVRDVVRFRLIEEYERRDTPADGGDIRPE